jgi:predicted metalloprotease with PDZ domain
MNRDLCIGYRRAVLAVLVAVLAGCAVLAQNKKPLKSINYRLSMSNPKSHLFEVKIEATLAPDSDSELIEFQMPKWSPGRYSVFDFAKNVQEVRAASGVCPKGTLCKLSALPVERVNDQTWRISTRGLSAVTLTYNVFGDDLSGTFSQLNEKHANYNGGSIFMYVVDHKPDPVGLTIDPPQGWRIANGRMDRDDQREWQFPNYDIMIDTPTEIAPDFSVDTFSVDGKQYRVMVHSLGNEGGKRPELVRGVEKIVRAETAMWGPPEFDSYTFLMHFAADDHSGDGMEHLTSTQIIEPGALADPGMLEDALDTASHEFFHVWNVKRLRPVGLGPWDFTKDARTRGLWVAEGFTNYYGHVMQRRAGIWTNQQLLDTLGGIISRVENNPGTRLMSAVESSLSAPFIDGSESIQKTNLSNTSVSYYFKGEVIALVLDSLIRKQTSGRASLDDVMRQMYDEFYIKSPNDSYYLRGKGYEVEDVERIASRVAGTDLHDFFIRYVWGVERLPYEEALAGIGVAVSREQPKHPSLGVYSESGKVRTVVSGSPAAEAGISQGDELLEIGGAKLGGQEISSIMAKYKTGDSIPVTLKRDRQTIKSTVKLFGSNNANYKLEPAKDSSGVAGLRNGWLAGTR